MNIPGLTTAHVAGAAIAARRMVTRDTEPESVVTAINGKSLIIGVTTAISSDEGDHTDVIRGQLALVVFGGTVKAGQPLTSDAEGRGVPAAAGDWYLGFAECDGEENDVGSVWIAPGQAAAVAAN
ncbi:DUF2190 family protein [Salmonella enterica]|uniref:DUF2190 domain-containing protein n=1 Tax=Salmonella enterica subsp. enterica serovar Panama TaxID=29472 RepID=A0A5U8J7S2_SALET|nr:capsid cement protein [Salmonella enterica]EBR7993316.1 DUF2190 domain-containing protein [Salmonella enterica subsp. enterica serovar Panama]ECC9937730.1 DUF2190 domain-containing protein [Salmonella enterica subsp. enterica]EEN2094721.1 DUF2190 family protein [Salmonella enterica subsp. enterica serovar Florida]ASD84986.1 DUF2190 domain-containing protein [Salmonella enterica subsp. enterica serovar India str. SA20085604]EBR8434097.1 DUF2190 domain-containing protein [Salmonella enterica 